MFVATSENPIFAYDVRWCHPHAQEGQQNPLYAVADGKVFRAGYQNPNDADSGLGFRLSTSDEDGYYQYGHLDPDSLTVSVGDTIKKGNLIGSYADPTNGGSSGPHVHLERRLWSNPRVTVNPGNISPLRPTGVISAHWNRTDRVHKTPHQGIDWAYPRSD